MMLMMLVGRLVFLSSFVKQMVVSGVNVGGLMMMVQLVVSVGVILWVVIVKGKFYGVMKNDGLIGCCDMIM